VFVIRITSIVSSTSFWPLYSFHPQAEYLFPHSSFIFIQEFRFFFLFSPLDRSSIVLDNILLLFTFLILLSSLNVFFFWLYPHLIQQMLCFFFLLSPLFCFSVCQYIFAFYKFAQYLFSPMYVSFTFIQ
jgi:hypothetical protein